MTKNGPDDETQRFQKNNSEDGLVTILTYARDLISSNVSIRFDFDSLMYQHPNQHRRSDSGLMSSSECSDTRHQC